MSEDSTISSRFEEIPDSPKSSTSTLPLPTSSQKRSEKSTTLEKELEKNNNKEGNSEDEDDNEDSIWYTPNELIEILTRSNSLKQSGNIQFSKGEYESALIEYKEGLIELPIRTKKKSSSSNSIKNKKDLKGKGKSKEGDILDELTGRVGEMSVLEGDINDDEDIVNKEPEQEDGEEEESEELTELRSILYANIAACLIKLNRWKEAVSACDDALEDNPTYVKALHRRAMAAESIGSWSSLSSALEDYKTLAKLPNLAPSLLATIKQGEKRLPNLINLQQQKEKDEVLGKLKDLGNTVLGKFGFSTDNFKFTQQEGGGYSMNFER